MVLVQAQQIVNASTILCHLAQCSSLWHHSLDYDWSITGLEHMQRRSRLQRTWDNIMQTSTSTPELLCTDGQVVLHIELCLLGDFDWRRRRLAVTFAGVRHTKAVMCTG